MTSTKPTTTTTDRRVTLFNQNGHEVAIVKLPPFKRQPHAIIWGTRFFILRVSGKYTEGFVYAANNGTNSRKASQMESINDLKKAQENG